MKKEFLILLAFAFTTLMQILPHPYNISPIGAFALLSGAYLADKRLLVLPLAVLLISDTLNGFYALLLMVFVYIGFLGSSLVGRWLLMPKRTPTRVLCACVAGALVFYFISNTGDWLSFYPHTLDGFLLCMMNGLPFLLRSLAGDLVYAGLLFAMIELLGRQVPEHQGIAHRYLAA
ncbi:MAG: DUF6580 family putative transport protein [Gammaproteobacteria bacterium]